MAGTNFPDLFPPPSRPMLEEGLVDKELFFLPHLIIWHPYSSFPDLFPPESIMCPSCGSPTSFYYWNDGSASHLQPRIIHDVENYVLLVSAVYVCPSRHRLLANDVTVLEKFPSIVPFVLCHRTGFTENLISLCYRLLVHGVNFYQIESLVLEKRWVSYSKKLAQLNCYKQLKGEDTIQDDFMSSCLSQTPSDSVFRKVFLSHFLLNEKVYLQEMAKVPVTPFISFDHTFRVAANIGYLRKDGKWVPQYDSMFIVMNEVGEIVTWQLTKGTSFGEVNQLLEDLKSHPNSNIIKTVYIDDCCKLRKRIETVFGENVAVKLDLFHATQRISKTLNKRSPLFAKCIQDLRLVFRTTGDYGVHREHCTPESQVMEKNVDDFVQKWTGAVDSSGYSVFTSNTVHETTKLKKHIRKGCLSDIPPGAGTNRNERFHHHINAVFHRSKTGILLAYALLTVIIHAYNNSIKSKGKLIYKPIETVPFNTGGVTLKPIGITPHDRTVDSEDGDHWEIDVAGSLLDLDVIVRVYTLCWKKYKILKSLLSMGLSAVNEAAVHFKPFGHCPAAFNIETETIHEQLSKHGLKCIRIDGDGNCFFRAVASSMLNNTSQWKENLRLAGLEMDDVTVDVAAQAFRQAFVNELTGTNRATYEQFLVTSDTDYDEEVEKMSQSGFYDSDIGDTMPLALCTALKFSMLIYSTDSRLKPIFISPEAVLHEQVVILIHTTPDPANGLIKGHYDYALPIYRPQTQAPEECTLQNKDKKFSCRCGVNKIKMKDEESSWSCKPSPFYPSRCKCYKHSRPCTTQCKCRRCSNPYGCKPACCEQEKSTRKKRKHCLQVSIPSSKRFAEIRDEKVAEGFWSEFETLVLQEVISEINAHEDHSGIEKLYNDIVYYATSSFCSSPLPPCIVLRKKTSSQVLSKVNYIETHSMIF